MPAIGDTIDRFVIEAVLGEGGMGRVYRALDPRLGRRIALKVMLAEGASDAARAEAAARMEREARAAAAFNHPNVVAIYEVGEVDGSPYIAMELVTGRTLRAVMADRTTTEAERLSWLLDVARGLGAAHRAGLVHRDIKPDNVMMTTDGVVKVLDFGIARQSEAAAGAVDPGAPTISPSPVITAQGVAIGTPQYMAPEQIRGEPLDGRADQFAWGVMAFEVLAGKLPWANAPSAPALFAAVLTANAPVVSDLVPTLDWRVGHVIGRALENTREARFPTMEALLAAVEAKDAVRAAEPGAEDLGLAATTAQPVTGPRETGAAVSPRAVTVGAPPPETASARAVASTAPVPAPRRGPPRFVAAMVAAVVVVGGGVALYHSAHRATTRYCGFLGDGADGPRCLGELAPEVAARRLGLTHRVTEVGGKIVGVDDVSFAGRRVGDAERLEIVRGESGGVSEILARDRHDNLDRWEKWAEGGKRIDLVDDDGVSPRRLRDTAITRIRRELDDSGRITSERYFAAAGRPACDEHKAYGYAYTYGHTPGRPVRKTVLGPEGRPAAESRGESVIETADDGTPGGSDVRYFDLEGKPVAVDGVYHHRRVWNDALEETDSVELGVHDEPIVNLDAGVHRERLQWDATRRTITETLFDEQERQHPAKSSSYSAVRHTYDERGRETLVEYLDAQGNRVYPKNAAAARRSGWDEHDDRILTEHLDVTGALMQGEWGYARQVVVRDEHGWLVEQRHYDENGKLAPWRDGGAIQKVTRDLSRGLALAEATFDAEGQPAPTSHGWATARVRYAALRNVAELSFFGPDGHPCINDEGYAVRRETFDDDGDGVTRAYFDPSGAPAMYKGEFAVERVTRDRLGNHAVDEYLDVHGERVLRRDGFSAVRFTHDANGDVLSAAYFGKRDEPIVREGGYAKKTTAYDVHRRPVETTLYDVAGAPAAGSAGWAIERDVYDDRGLLVRRDHLDAAHGPVLARSGSASTTWVHDPRGNVVEETSRGVDGKPVTTPEGYATRRSQYDERDQLVLESLLDAEGKPSAGKAGWSIRRLRYDEMGNLVEEAFYDGDHRPTTAKDAAYASVVRRVDARQRLVEVAYFDAGGAPAPGPEGVAAVRFKRDGYGHAVETAYVDGAGVEAPSTEGKLVVRTRFDDGGRPVEELFVDGSGALRPSKDGCAGRRTKYDPLGRKVEEACVDARGQVGPSTEGWAIRRILHDARGNAVDESTHGPDGALRADAEGIARRRHRFDERNLLRETTFFDANDKPAHDRRGVHAIRFDYGESGKKTGKTELDEKGQVVAPVARAR